MFIYLLPIIIIIQFMAVPKKTLKNKRVMGVVEESRIQVNTNAVATDESKMHKEPKTKSTGTGDNNAKVLYLNIIIYVFVWQLCCICCWRECLFPKSFFFYM